MEEMLEESIARNGRQLTIIYAPRERLAPAFGEAWPFMDTAYVRDDLPRLVKKFTRAHEIYHLIDNYKWWGRFGQELRANFAAAIECPLGFILAFFLTLTSRERLKLYADRIKYKY